MISRLRFNLYEPTLNEEEPQPDSGSSSDSAEETEVQLQEPSAEDCQPAWKSFNNNQLVRKYSLMFMFVYG